MNESPRVVFFFDYVDPGSYVMDVQLGRLLPGRDRVVRHPFELCAPPGELLDLEGGEWVTYRRTVEAAAADLGLELAIPDFTPWSRKAHELRLHAAEKGLEQPLHDALFTARFQSGADLGRVDVLVDLALGVGLDLTETKAVLDVDRFADQIGALRIEAEATAVTRPCTLRIGSESLEGPLPIDELELLLRAARLL